MILFWKSLEQLEELACEKQKEIDALQEKVRSFPRWEPPQELADELTRAIFALKEITERRDLVDRLYCYRDPWHNRRYLFPVKEAL